MYRPKDVSERLGISPATLRLWSTKFEAFLSPSAQRSTTENGGASQRRYDEGDLAYFLRAKQLLGEGLTYEEVAARLADGVPIVEHDNMRTDTEQSLPVPLISDVVVVSQDLVAYQKAIAALEQTIQAQQDTITTQQELIEALRERPVPSQTPSMIELPPMTLRQRLDWLLRGRMIQTNENERKLEPDGSNPRSLPTQESA